MAKNFKKTASANGEAPVAKTKAPRKGKVDFIPEEMMAEFNTIQAALASRKGGNKRDLKQLTKEELAAKAEKTRKRLAALDAALKG